MGFLNRVHWFDSGRGHQPQGLSGNGLAAYQPFAGELSAGRSAARIGPASSRLTPAGSARLEGFLWAERSQIKRVWLDRVRHLAHTSRVNCPTCGGIGMIDVVVRKDGLEGSWRERCETCSGNGNAPGGSVRDVHQLFPDRWPELDSDAASSEGYVSGSDSTYPRGTVKGAAWCKTCGRYSWLRDWDYQDYGTAARSEQCPCCETWRNAGGVFKRPWVGKPHSLGPLQRETERNAAAERRLRVTVTRSRIRQLLGQSLGQG
jgi:hypothetical protein